ncbi:hypothetical protein LA080_013662 [Diaporthe eres]|nr:hypothetical protein LA080_013662 [Diaporthe eres]
MVECGSAFVATAWKIYASQADTPLAKDLDQVQYLTQDVEKILVDLEQNGIPSTAALEDRDRDLLTLAAESRKITKEILDSLDKIGKPAAWKFKKHKAIQAAFMAPWNHRRIAELQSKLDGVRNEASENRFWRRHS